MVNLRKHSKPSVTFEYDDDNDSLNDGVEDEIGRDDHVYLNDHLSKKQRRPSMPRGPYKKRPLTNEQIKETISWLKYFSDRQLIKFSQITNFDVSEICNEQVVEAHLRQLDVGVMRKMWWYTRRVIRSKKISESTEPVIDHYYDVQPYQPPIEEVKPPEVVTNEIKLPVERKYIHPDSNSDIVTPDITPTNGRCHLPLDCSDIHSILFSPPQHSHDDERSEITKCIPFKVNPWLPFHQWGHYTPSPSSLNRQLEIVERELLVPRLITPDLQMGLQK